MTYTEPTLDFDANASARSRVKTANQFIDHIVNQYKSNYERFWQTPLTHGDRALSMAEMQGTLDIHGGLMWHELL